MYMNVSAKDNKIYWQNRGQSQKILALAPYKQDYVLIDISDACVVTLMGKLVDLISGDYLELTL